MRRPTSFETRAMAGSVLATLLLAGGTAFTIRRLHTAADEQIAHIQTKEEEITEVERLRWTGELIVSEGRGYLLSGDPDLLAKVHEVESEFDQRVRALRTAALSSEGLSRVTEVEQTAAAFRRDQEQLLADRQHAEDPEELLQRFESELRPHEREIGLSLDRLVDQKQSAIADVYDDARRERHRLALRLYGLLALLVALGFAITWFFARRLSRAHDTEQAALQTARKAVAARDELMGIVAHDLRNPLGAMTMKAALLRKKAESEPSRRQAKSIENIAMRMEFLIKSMLDGAALESGRLTVNPAIFDVDVLLRETREMFGDLSSSKQIRLELVSKESLAIRADRERVLQVISNLIGNALKFTPPGGQVALSIERRGEMACFAVRDTGPGITSDHLPNVFDRFWKYETGGSAGTGLGLFIAQGIVDAHGGRIWVESPPGHGATFYFTMPLADSLPAPLPEIEPKGPTIHA